jgi:hypothetical protein
LEKQLTLEAIFVITYSTRYDYRMATTPNPAGNHSGNPSVQTLEEIAKVIRNHVLDYYNVSMSDRPMYDSPTVVEDWNGPGEHAITWDFEIDGWPWVFRLGDLNIAGYWLEPCNSHTLTVNPSC